MKHLKKILYFNLIITDGNSFKLWEAINNIGSTYLYAASGVIVCGLSVGVYTQRDKFKNFFNKDLHKENKNIEYYMGELEKIEKQIQNYKAAVQDQNSNDIIQYKNLIKDIMYHLFNPIKKKSYEFDNFLEEITNQPEGSFKTFDKNIKTFNNNILKNLNENVYNSLLKNTEEFKEKLNEFLNTYPKIVSVKK
jgi:hypothetical protein